LKLHLLLEPDAPSWARGRVADARPLPKKRNNRKRFLIVDAAMNDLLRPSL